MCEKVILFKESIKDYLIENCFHIFGDDKTLLKEFINLVVADCKHKHYTTFGHGELIKGRKWTCHSFSKSWPADEDEFYSLVDEYVSRYDEDFPKGQDDGYIESQEKKSYESFDLNDKKYHPASILGYDHGYRQGITQGWKDLREGVYVYEEDLSDYEDSYEEDELDDEDWPDQEDSYEEEGEEDWLDQEEASEESDQEDSNDEYVSAAENWSDKKDTGDEDNDTA